MPIYGKLSHELNEVWHSILTLTSILPAKTQIFYGEKIGILILVQNKLFLCGFNRSIAKSRRTAKIPGKFIF